MIKLPLTSDQPVDHVWVACHSIVRVWPPCDGEPTTVDFVNEEYMRVDCSADAVAEMVNRRRKGLHVEMPPRTSGERPVCQVVELAEGGTGP